MTIWQILLVILLLFGAALLAWPFVAGKWILIGLMVFTAAFLIAQK